MTKPYIHGMLPDTDAPEVPHAQAPAAEIRFLGDMQRLQPKPGDVFVLSCEQRIDRATAERIKAELSGQLGGAKVLVLDGGLKLDVVAAPFIGVGLAAAPDMDAKAVVGLGKPALTLTMKPFELSAESLASMVEDMRSFARGEIVVQNTVGDVATREMVIDAIRSSKQRGGLA